MVFFRRDQHRAVDFEPAKPRSPGSNTSRLGHGRRTQRMPVLPTCRRSVSTCLSLPAAEESMAWMTTISTSGLIICFDLTVLSPYLIRARSLHGEWGNLASNRSRPGEPPDCLAGAGLSGRHSWPMLLARTIARLSQGPTISADENPRTATLRFEPPMWPVTLAIRVLNEAGSSRAKRPNMEKARAMKMAVTVPVIHGDCNTNCRFCPDLPAMAPISPKP